MIIKPYPNPNNEYKIAILIKEKALKKHNIIKYYIHELEKKGIDPETIVIASLDYLPNNKASVKLQKEHLNTLLKELTVLEVDTLLVADSNYFKTLTKVPKVEPYHGYIKPCMIKEYEFFNVILSINYEALFYDPNKLSKLTLSLDTLANHISKTHVDLGTNIIKKAKYLDKLDDIRKSLKILLTYPALSCDVETYSLQFWKAGLGTIAFGIDKHSGIAISIDKDREEDTEQNVLYKNECRKLLKDFFLNYKGILLYHNANFDIKILIYELFMESLSDNIGLLYGLEIMYQNVHCTKVITYLATNSTSGNNLSLKANSFEYTGNYAQEEIDDITKIPKQELLTYNLTDCVATWYVYTKYYQKMIDDEQLSVYETIFHPSMKVITNMELIGMPMHMETILKTEKVLKNIQEKYLNYLTDSNIVKDFELARQFKAMEKKNSELKRKVKAFEEFEEPLNPNSGTQVGDLLYKYMNLPIINKTDTGQPSTNKDTLIALLNMLTSKYKIKPEELE